MNKNRFSECEWYGRNIFEKLLIKSGITSYQFSDDLYSIWDCIYQTEELEIVVEIKVRDNKSNDYPDWILEFNKYESLMNKVEELKKQSNKKVIAIYVNFFSDFKVSIWNLDRVDISNMFIRNCKKTTVVDKGYVNKSIIPLLLSDAIKFGSYEE